MSEPFPAAQKPLSLHTAGMHAWSTLVPNEFENVPDASAGETPVAGWQAGTPAPLVAGAPALPSGAPVLPSGAPAPLPPSGESRSTFGSIQAVERAMDRLGARARTTLLVQRTARLLGAVIAAVAFLGAADYALRLPMELRIVHLTLSLALLGFIVWRIIVPACRLRPTLSTLALRVEKSHPELAGLLASGIEFDADQANRLTAAPDQTNGHHARQSAPSPVSVERALAQRVIEEAGRRVSPDDLRGLIRMKPLRHSLTVFAMALVMGAGIVFATPELASIGARRTLLPWAGADWPKRTDVEDATGIDVYPLGAAIPLRAILTRTNRPPDRADVAVEYREIRGRATGPTRRELMTWQQRDESNEDGASGALFERLVEASAEALEYRYITFDDRSEWRRILLVPPPAVLSARGTITPPDYAAALGSPAGRTELSEEVTVELGAGTDERAVAPPALAGSRIQLDLTLNKAIPVSPDDPVWIVATLGPDFANAEVTTIDEPAAMTDETPDTARRTAPPGTVAPAGEAGAHWRIVWTLTASVRAELSLRDAYGIESAEEIVYRFESVQDRPASATVTAPASDMNVLATAVVRVVGEGRDDVGLSRVALDRQRMRPAGSAAGQPSGPGGALEPTEQPVEISIALATGQRELVLESTLDLAPLGLRPGDQVWLRALASDVFALSGASHEAAYSPTRILRIITESDFIEEIRAEFSSIRQSAIRLHDQERELRELPPDARAGVEARRSQSQISERLARLGEQVEQLQKRIEDNALNDQQLENVIDDAARFVSESGKWSSSASDRQLEAAQAEENALDPEAERRIDDAQQRVQDELAGLAELLDSGEDAWVARRQLEELLNQQQELQEQTAGAARATAGRSAEQLTPDERTELDRIVEKQLELAQKTEDLAQDIEDRARQLQEHDPAAAGGMRQAARRARESQVAQKMEEAAQQAQQNQMARAGEQQAQAAADLQEMLEDMNEAEQSREEALRRVLASLIESLEAIISQQRIEINALADAAARAEFTGLDQSMILLNRNALGVLDQASGAGRELAPVANLIGRAIESQTQAIIALRADPVDAQRADDQERRSLELLQQARDVAEKIDKAMQEREQDRARQELRRAYREALEKQVALRGETGEYAALAELDRRQRAGLRRLGQEQRELQTSLRTLLEQSKDLSEASVFEYAHRRLDDAAGLSAEALADTDPARAVPPEEIAVALLKGLVDALKDSPPKQDDFNTGAGAGGGSGAGGPQPLIPPIAELRLLRQIQGDLARRTRVLDDEGGDADRAALLGEEQSELGELGKDLVRRMQSRPGPSAPTPTNPPDGTPSPPTNPPPDQPSSQEPSR